MSNTIGNVQFGSPEAVIAESIRDVEIGRAIFSTEARFGELLVGRPDEHCVKSRLTRLVGRRILFTGGLSPIAMGSEMVVVGDFATGEVRKYAYLSKDPQADAEIEREDQRLCREYLGIVVVEKSFEVVKLNSPVLVERLPWLDIVPLLAVVPNDAQDKQADKIAVAAERMFDETGLSLDGSSLEVERDTGRVRVLDTCLVDPSDIIGNQKALKRILGGARVVPMHRRRSWHSLDLHEGDSMDRAA